MVLAICPGVRDRASVLRIRAGMGAGERRDTDSAKLLGKSKAVVYGSVLGARLIITCCAEIRCSPECRQREDAIVAALAGRWMRALPREQWQVKFKSPRLRPCPFPQFAGEHVAAQECSEGKCTAV
ncbi:unnamed protein product [Coccothraustes coccothraustes]